MIGDSSPRTLLGQALSGLIITQRDSNQSARRPAMEAALWAGLI